MACVACKVEKLSNEFPKDNISLDCDHPSLVCLRCAVNHAEKYQKCPFPGCNQLVPNTSAQLQLYKAILSSQFKEYESAYTPPVAFGNGMFVNITGLTGESLTIPFSPYTTVDQLKTQIHAKFKHEKGKQKLLYEGKEMNILDSSGNQATLSSFGVKPNSTICLVIRLFNIPENFDDVIFDLFWGYPYGGRDYLDASCLLFSGTSFHQVIDYSHTYSGAIHHSGDVMDDRNRKGHHTINVSLKKIPASITHLFFTLSAWSSPSIAHYPNPSLKFFDAKKPGKDLCKTTFSHARNSRAVVMCSVSKNPSGQWQIFESGQLSAGNARNYDPIKQTIQQLIKQGI